MVSFRWLSLTVFLAFATVEAAKCATRKGRRVNKATIAGLKFSEGWRPDVYTDPTGHGTVGYGHLCQEKGCAEVKRRYPIPMSERNGEKLMKDDLVAFQNCIAQYISVSLNANQYGALVSWAYNFGCEQIRESKLISRLNAGENRNLVAEQELRKWVNAGGRRLNGLVKRRARETKLFMTKKNMTGKGISRCTL